MRKTTSARAFVVVLVAAALLTLAVVLFGPGASRDPNGGLAPEELAPLAASSPTLATEPSAEEASAGARRAAASGGVLTDAPSDPQPVDAPGATAEAIGARIAGRVIDERRRPVADVAVRLVAPRHAALGAATDAEGRYALEGVRAASATRSYGVVHAVGPDGRAAAGIVLLPREGDPARPPVADLVLGPARDAIVEVLDAGVPAAGAEVQLSVGFERCLCGIALTDPRGVARFAAIPLGSLHAEARLAPASNAELRIGRASLAGDAPSGTTLRVELEAARDVVVTVREAGTAAPRAGVTVTAVERVMPPRTFMRSGDVWVPDERAVAGGVGTTDAEGRTVLRGLPRVRLTLEAGAPAASPMERTPSVRLDADAAEALIELKTPLARRKVRWPIVAGEVPAPPSGARIVLRPRPGSAIVEPQNWPTEGAMEGAELVVDGVPAERFSVIATAPDGSVASLFAAEGAVGREASFRRARTITVRVTHASGAPAEGYGVGATNDGNNEIAPPVSTGADGVARLTGLIGALTNVHVRPKGQAYGGWSAGSVDLTQGDGDLAFTLPAAGTATLRVLVDGEPRLLPSLTVRGATLESEDPDRALLHVLVQLPRGQDSVEVFVGARDYGGGRATLTRAALDSAVPIDVTLARLGALLVTVDRAEGARVKLVAERANDDGSWQRADPFEHEYPNSDDGRFRLDGLAPGSYRVRDNVSGLASDAVVVDPRLGDARVSLSVARVGVARGRVVVPGGFDLALARVVVAGEGVAIEQQRWDRIPGAPLSSVAVRSDGSFEVPVSFDVPVSLRAWHPELTPAPENGAVTLNGPREDLALALVAGPTCTWTMPAGAPSALRVLLYADATRTQLVSEHNATVRDGRARFGGFAPGAYTLWLDAGVPWAPFVRDSLELRGDVNDLGALALGPGSALRIRIQVAASASAPRILVSAFSEALGPDGQSLYNRQLNSRGESEVVLSGLGPGTFRVRAGRIGGGVGGPGKQLDTTLVLDGQREEVLELDP